MNETRPSRRSLLMAGASTAAAALFAGNLSAAEPTALAGPLPPPIDRGKHLPAKFKLSMSAYSYRQLLDTPGKPGKMSLFDITDICADLGLDAIETTSYYFLNDDDDWVYKLKRHIYLRGLTCSGMPIRDNFALPDGPEFDAQVEYVKKWVDIGAKLGAPCMRVFAGSPNKAMAREQTFKQVVKGLKRCCDYAGTRGIFLAIENHHFMTEGADDVIRIIEGVNHPWLGANLDTGNFFKYPDGKPITNPYDHIRKLAPYAVVAQCKIAIASEKKPGTKEPIDYARVFKILTETGYRGYVALEYEGKEDPRTGVPKEIRKMQAGARA